MASLRFLAGSFLAVALVFSPAARADHQIDDIVFDLQESADDYRWLRDSGRIEFSSSQDEIRYQRAFRRLRTAIRKLEDYGGGGGGGGQNWRGRAVVSIRQHVHSAYASDVIARLPEYVTGDDFTFIEYAAQNMHGAYVAGAVGQFYTNPSNPSRWNRRGLAARGMIEHMHSAYVGDAMEQLGSFVSEDEAGFIAYLAENVHGAYVAANLAAYNTHPSSPRRDNHKGTAGKAIVEIVHSAYREDCFKALPGYVSEGDAPYVRQLLEDTHGAYAAQALREFFGTVL